ncbi:MAG TPA: glutathione peroxidase [Firmicutes bacterium]|jgi:glutathione peroxidase|nr:glutathione peroxidase [Bacillota bacterium]
MNIYQITVEDANNQKISLEKYKGKVMLIVNTATNCIFTPQYKSLQYLYDKYHDQGLEILDFPCNQFANSTPGTPEEIEQFCAKTYNTKFDRFAKIDVNGPDENLLFTFLKLKKGGMFRANLKWNFTKFLVDREGKVVARFGPSVKPEKIEKYILPLL